MFEAGHEPIRDPSEEGIYQVPTSLSCCLLVFLFFLVCQLQFQRRQPVPRPLKFSCRQGKTGVLFFWWNCGCRFKVSQRASSHRALQARLQGYICFCEWPQECSQTSGGDNKRRRGRVCGGDVDISPGLVYMADPSSCSLLPSSFPKEMKERARKRKINHQPLVWSLNKMDWK